MKTLIRPSLKSGGTVWLPALLVAATVMLSSIPSARADDDHRDRDSEDRSSSGKTLARVFHDTYWRWFYGDLTLPKDENANAVLNGIALLPLPNAPGDGTPGSIDITLRGGQSFFLPLFGFQGTSYTDGTPPDPFLDLEIFKTLVIKFTIDGKTVVDSKNVMDYYAESLFVPPFPFPVANLDYVIWFQSIGVLREPLSPGKHVLKLDVKNTIPGFGFISEFHNTFNITVSPRVVSPTEQFKGRTYAEWSAKWWEWLMEYPVNDPRHPHPSLDANFDVRAFQDFGDVWFLAGPFGTTEVTLTVPSGKAFFFPVFNAEVSSLEDPPFHGVTEAEQRTKAKFFADHIVNPTITINGAAVGPMSAYRGSSPQFRFNAPTPWIYGATGGRGTSVGDGYYVLIESLPKGEHTIHVKGSFHFNAGEVPEFGAGPVDQPADYTLHLKVR